MGNLDVGDRIIITEVLTINAKVIEGVVGKSAVILRVDKVLTDYPFKVVVNNRWFWVEGVPYSSLMEELF